MAKEKEPPKCWCGERATKLYKVWWEVIGDDDTHHHNGKIARVCATHAQALVDRFDDAFEGR